MIIRQIISSLLPVDPPSSSRSTAMKFIIIIIIIVSTTLYLSLLSSSSSSSFVSAQHTHSTNLNRFFDYVETHTDCTTNTKLNSCDMNSAATEFFCGTFSGNTEVVTKFQVSPFAVLGQSADQTTGLGSCVLVEEAGIFWCVVKQVTATILYGFDTTSLTRVSTIAAPNAHEAIFNLPLLRQGDFLYTMSSKSVGTNHRFVRIADITTTAAYDTSLDFPVNIEYGNDSPAACISSSSDADAKLLAYLKDTTATGVILDVDISNSGTPNFAHQGSIVVDTPSLTNSETTSGMVCSLTMMYNIFRDDEKITRFRTRPVLEELDSIFFNLENVMINSLSIFADGQYALLSVTNSDFAMHLLDLSTFPHSLIESIPLTPSGETFSRAVLAIPSGVDIRVSSSTFKVFGFSDGTSCDVYEYELKNMDEISPSPSSVVRPPIFTYNETSDLSQSKLIGCEADSTETYIYCISAAGSTEVPCKVTPSPLAVAQTGSVTIDPAYCVLVEKTDSYYCLQKNSGLMIYVASTLAVRIDISSMFGDGPTFVRERARIDFASIAGTDYIFMVADESFIHRCETTGSDCTSQTSINLNTDAPGVNYMSVIHCPQSSSDSSIFAVSRTVGPTTVVKIDGGTAAFEGKAELSLVDTVAQDASQCAPGLDSLFVAGNAAIAKILLADLSVIEVNRTIPQNPTVRSLTISYDLEVVIMASNTPNVFIAFSTKTLGIMASFVASSPAADNPKHRCVGLRNNNRVYCPSDGSAMSILNYIPYRSQNSPTRTKSISSSRTLQSLTLTRTVSPSSTIKSVSSTATLFSQSVSLTPFSRTVTSTHTASGSLQSLTTSPTSSKSSSLRSLTITNSASQSSTLQSLTLTQTISSSPSLQSITSTLTHSASSTLQSLSRSRTLQSPTPTMTLSATVTPQSLTSTRTVTGTKSTSKSQSLQSLTASRTLSKSGSLQSLTSTTTKSVSSSQQSLTNTRTVSSTNSLQSLSSSQTKSRTGTLQSLTLTKTTSASLSLQSLTSTVSTSKTSSLQSLTDTRSISSSVSLQSLTATKTISSTITKSATSSLRSLTSTRSISNSASLQSLTKTSSKTKSVSLQSITTTRSLSASASRQSLTRTVSTSKSSSLQSLTTTKSHTASASLPSISRTLSSSKSASLQSLTKTRSRSISASLESQTRTRTASSTNTSTVSATLRSLTNTLSVSASATLQSLTKTTTRSASSSLQSLTMTASSSQSDSLQSLTKTRSLSSSFTLQSLTATRSVSFTASLQSLTVTRSSSKSSTLFSQTKTNSRSFSATPFSRSKSLSLISRSQTRSHSTTKSSTVTTSKSATASVSLQSMTQTLTLFSRSSTLSSSITTSKTSTVTLPPTASISKSITATRTRTASLQSLSKTKTLSNSLQSLTKTKTKTSVFTPPPVTTTTTTTTSAPDNAINNLPPSSNIVNALVVSVPSCPSSLNSKCQVRHPQSNECRCPQNTHEQNITLLPSFAFLPSTSPTSQLIDRVGNPCVRNEFILGICTASTSERFVSSYTRSGGTTSENGICEQANPFTNDCSCRVPSTKASFAIATGSSVTFNKRLVTFCLPPNGDLSVFWTIHPDVASATTSSNRAETSCVSPNGNVTCECAAGASKTTFGASIFPPDSTSTDPVPGDLTFCKAKPAEPEEEVNIPVTTTGTVVGIVGGFIEGGGANAVVGIQVAALLMTLCDNNPNVSTSGAKSVVVFFEYPGLPPSVGGLAFMLTLTLGVFVLHLLVCLLLGLKRFATSQKIEFDPDKIDFFEDEIETPSFFEQIRFASLQLRFPHWSFFVMNIGFSGVVVESTILLQNTEDDIIVLLGAIGLVLCLFYIFVTLYLSYWGIRGVADAAIFDVDESGVTKKLVKMKKKFKRAVAELTEVPITDDDEAFPSGGPKSRGVGRSSSRAKSTSRHHRSSRTTSSHNSTGGRSRNRSSRSSSKVFSPRNEKSVQDALSDSSVSSDEEKGHKWLNRRKSVVNNQAAPSSATSSAANVVLRSNSSRRRKSTYNNNNNSSRTTPSSRRVSSAASQLSSKASTEDEADSVIVVDDEDEQKEKQKEKMEDSTDVSSPLQDRRSSSVKMPDDDKETMMDEGDDDDEKEQNRDEKKKKLGSSIRKSSSLSSAGSSKRREKMQKVVKRNPLRPPPRRRIVDDEETSSAEDLDSSSSSSEGENEEEEVEVQKNTSSNNDALTDDDKPPHYVKYGKAMKLFHRFCNLSEYILPNGWWIKHRLYNRRYASMYNSFQPRPTAWAPTTIKLFLFSVSVASSFGGCEIPVLYVGVVALIVAIMFIIARPCRRPMDNFLLALQLILGSTLAFSRNSDPELSVKLFYGIIGITFLYVFHILTLETIESVSMTSIELDEYNTNHGGEDDREEED